MTPTNMFFFGIMIWVTSIAVRMFIEDNFTDEDDCE